MDLKKGVKKIVKDAEKAALDFDPFSARNNEHPTTDRETLMHLMKASLGTGILAMPFVFKISGLIPGFLAAIITSFVCSHCSYILVKCAHILYKRSNTSTLTFAGVAESAFENGPKSLTFLAPYARHFVTISLFSTYFGSCSVYVVILGDNTKQMYEYYTGNEINIRLCIILFLLPLILLTLIRSLKYLAPVSMLANVCMTTGLGITVYYFLKDLPDFENCELFGDLSGIPSSIAITIFAIEAIGVVMPLENQMKTPQNFVGIFGVMSKGMSFVTVIYLFIGFVGYWSFGSKTEENITINLPVAEVGAQIVKIAIVLGVLFTFSLQLYVCVEIIWNAMKDRFSKNEAMANYILRAVLVCCCVSLAIALPSMGPLIKLIGAFGYSSLGLIIPVIIEMITIWPIGFGRYNWIAYKNIVCIAFGLFALIFGSISAIKEIIEK